MNGRMSSFSKVLFEEKNMIKFFIMYNLIMCQKKNIVNVTYIMNRKISDTWN